MDHHALEYYQPYSDDTLSGNFHRVIALHDSPELKWEQLHRDIPTLCHGWYELAQLSSRDRIDLLHDFWLSKLPFHLNLEKGIAKFFGSLDDIGIFITQSKYDDPFDVQLVYSLKDNGGFFHGSHPGSEEEIIALEKAFPDYILPADYLSFLQVHDGFAKLSDTGIIGSAEVPKSYRGFQSMLEKLPTPVTSAGKPVNPKSLIPFYESFGMPFFQCFWADWYPENEMGNVYYSSTTNTISDCSKAHSEVETMAFETFTDWLLFYIEKIE